MLNFDFEKMMAASVGRNNGITTKTITQIKKKIDRACGRVEELRKGNEVRFFHLPYQDRVINEIKTEADRVAKKFDNFVLLGIGGSALGPIAVQAALKDPFWNILPPSRRRARPRMFFLDNIDPDLIDSLSKAINIKRTVFNVITKSGSTAETMSQFMIFRQKLIRAVGKEKAKSHIVAITDKENGLLRELVREEGYKSLEVPDGVGGRFSVLSPVGLFSAAVSGVNIQKLLDGAAAMDKICRRKNVWKNPALRLSSKGAGLSAAIREERIVEDLF